MMNNIKYRQYVGGKFHYWGFLQDDFTEKLCFVGPITNQMANPIHCQFSGLTDKNGVEIYEGDILTGGVGGDVKPVVVEWKKTTKWSGMADGYKVHNVGFYLEEYFFRLHECVVIGNIYQNPELLK